MCRSCGNPAIGLLCEACDLEARTAFIPLAEPESSDAGGYEPSIFEELAVLEPRSFWFRSRNRLLAWALQTYFPAARSFLEIGCGTGYTLAAIRAARPGLSVVGGELFADGLRVARPRLPDVPLFQLDARALPFEKDFDVVGAFDVLEHVPEDEAALRELRRVVVDGGGLIVTVPQHRWLWSAADDYGHHQRRYSRSELVAKLERAGFEPIRVTSFISLLLPVMLAMRRIGARSSESFDFRSEFRNPPLLDRALEQVVSVERALIRRGVSLPAGGSLLVVARAVG